MQKNKHGGNINEFIRKYNLDKKDIIDFSTNINPLGIPASIKKVLKNSINQIVNYPDPYAETIKKQLANYCKISSENLLVGNGSIDLIYLIFQALKPKNVLIPVPNFSEYEKAGNLNNAKIFFLKLNEFEDFKLNFKNVMSLIPKMDFIILSNPNNPTGSFLNYDEICLLINECIKQKTILVIDEAFIDFSRSSEENLILTKAAKIKYILVLRSLTKFFAIPGLRLGYMVGNKNLINKISEFQIPWSVNTFSQNLGQTLFQEIDFIKRSRKIMDIEKQFILENFNKINCLKVYPSSANFILCKINHEKFNVPKLADMLAKESIMIRDCSNFKGLNNKFFRIAVKTRKQNTKLIISLKKILETI